MFLVSQLSSYPGDYVSERPSIERIAETLEKLEEDVLRVPLARPRGVRRAILSFGEPIDARDVGSTAREATELLEARVQAILDELAGEGREGARGCARC